MIMGFSHVEDLMELFYSEINFNAFLIGKVNVYVCVVASSFCA